jgi:ABC-2 type transport system permease protein
MLPIIKKELRAYFNSMTGYIFLGFLVIITAIYFALICVSQLNPAYYGVISSTSIMFLILIPTLTMRLFAEEARQKTDQLLFTSPVPLNKIVLGKYTAALLLFLLGMAITAVFPMIIANYGTLPTAQIAGAFLGYILLGAAFIAVGMFISVLTENQIIAAVATFAVLFIFYIMDTIASNMPVDTRSSVIFICVLILLLAFVVYDATKNLAAGVIVAAIGVVIAGGLFIINNLIYDGAITKILLWFSVLSRFSNFEMGVLNLTDIVYYITFSMAFIYMTTNVIEKRRWR